MAELVRDLVLDAARAVGRTVVPARDGSEIDLEQRVALCDAPRPGLGGGRRAGRPSSTPADDSARAAPTSTTSSSSRSWNAGEIVLELYEKLVEHTLIQPTFVAGLPRVGPAAGQAAPDEPGLVEAFDLIINGVELAPAYSELNDPVIQRERLVEQSLLAAQGDPEAMDLDEDFLRALEFGMPPAGGMGMGVDRLVMLLTGAGIRETILFPLLRPNEPNSK